MNVATRPLYGISLFSGIGGLSEGVRAATGGAYRPLVFVEGEAFCAAVLAARMQDGSIPPAAIWNDVRSFDGKPWRGVVDLIEGGFPCQDLSVAGKRAGIIEGKRSSLWSSFARIIGEVRPEFVFVENVPGLLPWLGYVLGDLAQAGYDAEWTCLSAADVGASHRRERVFILARRRLADGQGEGFGGVRESQRAEGAQGRQLDGRDGALADGQDADRRAGVAGVAGEWGRGPRGDGERLADAWSERPQGDGEGRPAAGAVGRGGGTTLDNPARVCQYGQVGQDGGSGGRDGEAGGELADTASRNSGRGIGLGKCEAGEGGTESRAEGLGGTLADADGSGAARLGADGGDRDAESAQHCGGGAPVEYAERPERGEGNETGGCRCQRIDGRGEASGRPPQRGTTVADPERLQRDLEETGRSGGAGGVAGPTGGDMADADPGGRSSREQSGCGTTPVGRGEGDAVASRGIPVFPPGPGDRDAWARILAVRPDLAPALTAEDEVELEVRRVAHGTGPVMAAPSRVDALRSLGNAVVAQCAEAAFRELYRRLCE